MALSNPGTRSKTKPPMPDLDDIEKAIRPLNRQVDELAVRMADQLVAFGKSRAEKGHCSATLQRSTAKTLLPLGA